MKKWFFVAFLLSSSLSYSCDICGGVNGNASIGLFASNRFHTFGLKSGFRTYSTYMYGIRHTQEFIWSNELQFRTQLHKRIQLMGSLPYQSAIQKTDLSTDVVFGLADPNLMLNFILIQKQDSSGITKDFLSLGGSLKMPIGKNVSTQSALKNLYPGTGSWDETLILNYLHQFGKKVGWQTELSYAFKGKDKYQYRYGNTFSVSSQAVYSQKVASYRLIASLGALFDNHAASTTNRIVDPTAANNGFVVSAKASVNLLTYRWLWSVYAMQPVAQNINQGTIKQQISCGLSLNYLIKKSQKTKK